MPLRTVETNNARFAYQEYGPVDGPLALCLHGFPDTPITWRHLAPVLAEAGWRVITPYLRGFAPTVSLGQPSAGPRVLGADANALHEALLGDCRSVLIGHDWGAAAAYVASSEAPDRWSKVIAASWPPIPDAIDLASFEQMQRSWYVFLFQLEIASQIVLRPDFIASLWQSWSPRYGNNEEVAAAVAALNGPQGADLALAHYRALFSEGVETAFVPLHPTLYLHGIEDGCIGSELVHGLAEVLPAGSKVEMIPAVGHFPQLEAPTKFNEVVQAFLSN